MGVNTGVIETSYASGAVGTIGYVTAGGGLIGYTGDSGSISNCYATGAVQGAGSQIDVGGLVGANSMPISSSYSTGAVTAAAGSRIGGFVGYDSPQSGIANAYWDTTTSGITDPSQGAGNMPNDPGITGLTTTQLQSALPAGFDPAVWSHRPSINGGLPYLLGEPTATITDSDHWPRTASMLRRTVVLTGRGSRFCSCLLEIGCHWPRSVLFVCRIYRDNAGFVGAPASGSTDGISIVIS